MKCKHTTTTTGNDYCFRGSVACYPHTEENRAAHGGTRHQETCRNCGARRVINSNGGHFEFSTWGPDRTERLIWVKQCAAKVKHLRDTRPSPLTYEQNQVTATIEEDGRLLVEYAQPISPGLATKAEQDQAILSLPIRFLTHAQELRTAHLAMEAAERDA